MLSIKYIWLIIDSFVSLETHPVSSKNTQTSKAPMLIHCQSVYVHLSLKGSQI